MKGFFFIFIILFGFTNIKAQHSGRSADFFARRLLILQRAIKPLYRKPTKKELKTIEPDRRFLNKYSDFLRQPNTGLTKLIADRGCADNTKIVIVSEECLKYTMPGAGSSFSFRKQTYSIARLADITYTDNSFQATGVFLHGIFVNIGDVPLERITLQTEGLKYLAEFQPESDYEKNKEIDLQLAEGIESDGFLYRRGLYIVLNTTFVLRSIAYDGKYMRAIRGVTYDEFDFDKRKDVIVAFRIVEKDEQGNVTILWKKIQESDSPKIKNSE